MSELNDQIVPVDEQLQGPVDRDRHPRDFFPFTSIRPAQEEALRAWDKIIEKDKRFAVFELPTGTGKSGLAYSIGRWAGTVSPEDHQPGAYILTTQKTLQAQYMRDFEEAGMVELKGSGNYTCTTMNTDCKSGKTLHKINKALVGSYEMSPKASVEEKIAYARQHPTKCYDCPYDVAKGTFMAQTLGVTNFSYMLTEANHVRRMKPRSLLIIDEAHNTESQLLGFVEIEVTAQRADFVGASQPPQVRIGDFPAARAWILDELRPKVAKKIIDLHADLMEAAGDGDTQLRDRIQGRLNGVEQFNSRLDFISGDGAMDDWFAYSDPKTGALKLRPLTAKSIAEEFLFRMGHKLLFLSATILDGQSFIRGLGLDGAQGGFKRVDSDFPVENRLMHLYPTGSMSFKNKEATTPKLVKMIEKVLNKHGDEKGIIHANSYQLKEAIVEHLRGTKHNLRILTHDNSPGSRETALEEHIRSKEPTVLISPSMTEGLDLSEDLGRFQIMPKVPYPSLGDPFVKARMAHDSGWYPWQTALSIVQATGRSIRSRDDKATTYMLDSDFEAFLTKADNILPTWWKKAIVQH
jgi:Rad3-related DNA helicase